MKTSLRDNTIVHYATAAVNHADVISRRVLGYTARAALVGGGTVAAVRFVGNHTHPYVRHPAVQAVAAFGAVVVTEATILVLGNNPVVEARRVARGMGRLDRRMDSDLWGWGISEQEREWIAEAFENQGIPVEGTGEPLRAAG